MFQHIRHDIGEVFLCDELLLVAQFDDSVSHTTCLFWRKFQSQLLKVLEDVRLARVLAQRILTLSAKTLRQQVVTIEVVLVVAISVNTSHLREDILSDNRFIGWNGNTRQALHHRGHLAEILFIDMRLHVSVILQNGLHGRKGRIACPFAKTVHSGMHTSASCQNGSHHIAGRQVVVVVRMKIKLQVGITAGHLTHECGCQLRIEDAQRVGQHETLHTTILQRIHKAKHIVRAVLHAVRPILQIEVHANAQLLGIADALLDVRHMLLQRLLQLVLAMTLTTLAEQVDVAAFAVVDPVERSRAIHKSEHLHPVKHACLTSPSADTLHRFLLSVRHTRRSHLNAIHIQVHQQHTGNHQLLVGHKTDAVGLFTIAQRRVHDFYELFHTIIHLRYKVTQKSRNHMFLFHFS